VKVDALIDEGSISSVKKAPIFVLIGILVAPFGLTVKVTCGLVVSAALVLVEVVTPVVPVVTGVVACVDLVVVLVVLLHAVAVKRAIIMTTDAKILNTFFFFTSIPPYYFKNWYFAIWVSAIAVSVCLFC
jgi:hypothetical protein